MPRPNKATVGDAELKGAFAQGVEEGFRLVDYCLVTMWIGDRIHQQFEAAKMSEIPQLVLNFMSALRGEHYDQGVQIHIVPVAESPDDLRTVAEVSDGEDSSIIDAEVVDE